MIRGQFFLASAVALSIDYCTLAGTYALNPAKTYSEGMVQSGSVVSYVSDTYTIDVPEGMYAKVRLSDKGFSWGNCRSSRFTASIGGKQISLDGTVEVSSATLLTIAISCKPDVYCNPYNVAYYNTIAGVRFPHYFPTYHEYSNYYARQSYAVTVTYGKKLPDLVVASVSLSSPAIAVDETGVLSFTVKNAGRKASSSLTVSSVYDNGRKLGDFTVKELACGETSTYSVNIPKPSEGVHELRILLDATRLIDESSEANNEAKISLRAYSRTPVAVTYNMNGVDDSTTVSVIAGDILGALPVAVRKGYEFCGWWTTEVGGEKIEPSEKITESQTFYAHWTAKRSSISFNRQRGSGGTRTATVTYDTAMPSINVPSRTGYDFCGYWSKPGGGGIQYYSASGTAERIWDEEGDAVLYAKWTGKKSVLAIDNGNGTDGLSSVTVVYGEILPSLPSPKRSGWEFQGYFSDTDGNGIRYYAADGSSDIVWRGTKPMSLYAYWTPQRMSYVVTFDKQGGISGANSTVVSYGTALNSVDPPKRAQYTFKGYYSALNGNGVKYFNSDGTGAALWNDMTVETLYAKWDAAYGVVLDANGGVGQEKVWYFTEEEWTLPPNTFTSNGCVFAGWALTPNGQPVFPDAAVLDNEVLGYKVDATNQQPATLYAKFGRRLTTSLFPEIVFVTGGSDSANGWFVENGALRSSPHSGMSWLSTTFDGSGDVKYECNALDGLVLTISDFDGICTNYCSAKSNDVISVSQRRHIATFSYDKWSIAASGIVPSEDTQTLVEKRGGYETAMESNKQAIKTFVSSAIGSRYSYSVSYLTDAAVDETFENHIRGTATSELYNEILSRCTKKGLNTYILSNAIKNGLSIGYEFMNMCNAADANIRAIHSIESWMNSCGEIFGLDIMPTHIVGFATESSFSSEDIVNVKYVESRIRSAYYDYIPTVCSAVTYYTAAANADDWRRITEECLRAVENGTAYSWWDGDLGAYIRSTLGSRKYGYNVSGLKNALQYSDFYVSIVIAHAKAYLDSIQELRNYASLCGVTFKGVKEGLPIGTLPTPDARNGFTFCGWWTDPDGGEKISEECGVNGDSIFYSHWEQNEYTLSFVSNGGEACSSRRVLHGEGAGNLPVPERDGYTFEGWYLDSLGNVAEDDDIRLTTDTVLYAQWTRNPITSGSTVLFSSSQKTGSGFFWNVDDTTGDDTTGVAAQTVTIAKAGWNLVSFNVLPDDPSPAAVFGDVADKIQSVVSGTKRWTPQNGGRLTELKIGVGYWVNTASDNVTWTISGTPNEGVAIQVNEGWNLVGYPLLESGDPGTVLKSAADAGIVSSVVSGTKRWTPQSGGRLTEMSPGVGYWMKAEKAATITFDK